MRFSERIMSLAERGSALLWKVEPLLPFLGVSAVTTGLMYLNLLEVQALRSIDSACCRLLLNSTSSLSNCTTLHVEDYFAEKNITHICRGALHSEHDLRLGLVIFFSAVSALSLCTMAGVAAKKVYRHCRLRRNEQRREQYIAL